MREEMKMAGKCFRCGSDNLVKVVPAKSLVIPEIKQEVETGIAEVSCGCTGFFSSHITRCRNCGFKWDDIMERQMMQQE